MLVFDGTYALTRKDDPGATPVSACAWRVKIVDFSSAGSSQAHIRPLAVLAFRKAGGLFQASCAESLGKRICRDFDLDVRDILWLEAFPELTHSLYAAVFRPRYTTAGLHYTVAWRPALVNELAAVASWCSAKPKESRIIRTPLRHKPDLG